MSRRPPSFVFVGNHRALDFVNTEVAAEGVPRDLLAGFPDLVSWLERAGAIDRATARTARGRWGGRRGGDVALADARALRAGLRRLADAAAHGQPIPRDVLGRVNALLGRGASVVRVLPDAASGFVTRRGLRLEQPGDLLVPLAE